MKHPLPVVFACLAIGPHVCGGPIDPERRYAGCQAGAAGICATTEGALAVVQEAEPGSPAKGELTTGTGSVRRASRR